MSVLGPTGIHYIMRTRTSGNSDIKFTVMAINVLKTQHGQCIY